MCFSKYLAVGVGVGRVLVCVLLLFGVVVPNTWFNGWCIGVGGKYFLCVWCFFPVWGGRRYQKTAVLVGLFTV